jgi:hypothetical protein
MFFRKVCVSEIMNIFLRIVVFNNKPFSHSSSNSDFTSRICSRPFLVDSLSIVTCYFEVLSIRLKRFSGAFSPNEAARHVGHIE